MPSERALIVEPGSGCHIRDGQSLSQSATGGTQPDLGQVGMWREPHRTPEQPDELESREPDVTGELLEAEILGVASAHDLNHPVRQGSVPRGRLDAAAAAAMPLEQPPERPHQKLALVEGLAVRLERAMQRQKSLDEIGVAKQVLGEVGQGLDPKLPRDGIDRGLRQV